VEPIDFPFLRDQRNIPVGSSQIGSQVSRRLIQVLAKTSPLLIDTLSFSANVIQTA
jgi:hypothetical protein